VNSPSKSRPLGDGCNNVFIQQRGEKGRWASIHPETCKTQTGLGLGGGTPATWDFSENVSIKGVGGKTQGFTGTGRGNSNRGRFLKGRYEKSGTALIVTQREVRQEEGLMILT